MKGIDTKLNILVAESDELNRILLCEIIEKYGCTYKAADNGRAAVDLFLEEHFDLIMLDLQMPVVEGFETARAVREIESEGFGHTLIAALSVSAPMNESEQTFAGEIDYYLMKPYFPQEIYKLLDKVKVEVACIPGTAVRQEDSLHIPDEPEQAGAPELYDSESADHLSREEMCQVFEKMDYDAQFFQTLLEKFKESSAELLDKIREAIRENNCEALVEYTHALKGEFHIFNAAVPVRIAEAMERVSRTGCVPDSAQDVVAKLEEDVWDIIESYTEFLNEER